MLVTKNKVAYSAGELSPRLYMRSDLIKYQSGLKTLENCKVLPYGGVQKRPGTHFVAETKDSTKASRLVPFVFNEEQSYILEFGENYIRFFTNSGVVGAPLEVVTTYTEAELPDLHFSQSADVLFIVHPNHPPAQLSRTSALVWTLADSVFIDGPYLPGNTDDAHDMTPSVTTGPGTLTSTDAYFTADMVGAFFRVTHGATTGYCIIDAFTSDLIVDMTVLIDFGNTTATEIWSEGAWSAERGFPSAIAFYDQRLFMAGTTYEPQTFWGSKVGVYLDHTPDVNDEDAVNYTLSGRRLNPILWLSESDYLLIGTTGSEYRAGHEENPITPTDINVKRQTSHGSDNIQPEQIGNVTIFVQRTGKKLRELVYNPDTINDKLIAKNISVFSEHIAKKQITDIAYQEEPDPVLWAVLANGQCGGLTHLSEHEVLGWARHITAGTFESVEVIPVSTHNQAWFIVNRTIDGATKRYVEYLDEDWDSESDMEDAKYVDSGLTYSGASTDTLTGLDHLEGEDVAILADGNNHPPKTVVSGGITLNYAVTKAQVGLKYTAKVETLPPVFETREGTSHGQQKRKSLLKPYVFETLGLLINGLPAAFRDPDDDMDTAPPHYTGFLEDNGLGSDENATTTYTHDLPTPFTLLGEVDKIEVHSD